MRGLSSLLTAACCAAASVLPARQAATTALPSNFAWSSSGPLIEAKPNSGIAAIKDPSIIFSEDKYHVFASTARADGYNLVYFTFTDFAEANASDFTYLDRTPLGTGYRAAPEVFYFAPQKLWYLIYQNGNAAYSTNTDINDPQGWTAPTNFYNGTPQIVTDNIGDGYWVDMWVICDATNCHLFSSDDNGHLYRSQTLVEDFPNGMSEPVTALSDADQDRLFEASNVYNVGNGTYLLLVEAIGSDSYRWFRSWTSTDLAGPWTPLAAEEDNPFMRSNNIVFEGEPWTKSISHGEIIRTELDQTLTIRPCEMRYLYQGLSPNATGAYNALPWKLGLLTQTNFEC